MPSFPTQNQPEKAAERTLRLRAADAEVAAQGDLELQSDTGQDTPKP